MGGTGQKGKGVKRSYATATKTEMREWMRSPEYRDQGRRSWIRAMAYQHALRQLRDRHRAEFDVLVEEARGRLEMENPK